ncbi:MAG: FHA domain-containing protein, partial [Planctomycetota bacterium]
MARLLIRSGERRQVFAILDEEFTLGSSPDNVLHLDRPGVAATHLRFVSLGADQFRVEPAGEGAELRIGGRVRRAHLLAHGDRIDVAGVALAFWADGRDEPEILLPEDEPGAEANAPAGLGLQIRTLPGVTRAPVPLGPIPGVPRGSPTSGPRPVRRAPQAGRASEPGGEGAGGAAQARKAGPSARMIRWNAAVAAVALGLVLHRCFGGPGDVKPVADLIRLAESQRAVGAVEDARRTLDLALTSGPTPDEVARVHQMRRTLDVAAKVVADQEARNQAFRDLDQLRRFADRYLGDSPPARPAAREGLALCVDWIDAHRPAAGSDEGRAWRDEVEAIAARCRASAAVGEPAEAADVLFSARRRARFRPRHFPDAVRILSEWLETAAADAPQRGEVEEGRDRVFRGG